MTLTPTHVATAWRDRADELCRWVLERLVVRRDVWGGYIPQQQRGKSYIQANGTTATLGATLTRPAVKQRGKVLLTEDVVRRHFCPRHAGDIIGLHTTSPDNTCRWGALDIDRHGSASPTAEATWHAAQHWFGGLTARGFSPLLTESNGAGGYHLRVLLAKEAPAPQLYHFLRGLVADHARAGLSAPPETFPKQASLKPGCYGNWLRLPGRHHSREHWSRVWDGRRWLEGADAVAHLLRLRGDSAALLPVDLPMPGTPPHAAQPTAAFPGHTSSGGLAGRITRYLTYLPNRAEGQGRDDVAYQFAAFLTRDLALPDDVALVWLQRWDAGNSPPKGRERLQAILANAHKYAKRPLGCGRNDGTFIVEI